jgi:uncharacterized protein (TIGR03083 family)
MTTVDWHIDTVQREGELLADSVWKLLRDHAYTPDLDTMVPSCPEWTVRELVRHVGRVHRWAGAFVRDKLTEEMLPEQEQVIWGTMPEDADLLEWFQLGHSGLVTALREATDDLACWSFLPAPTPRAFWARRQAHETAIHRIDAQLALNRANTGQANTGQADTGQADTGQADTGQADTGRADSGTADPVSPEFADDGVDELLTCFYGRPNRVRSGTVRTLAVSAQDTGGAWLVRFLADGARGERVTAVPDADCRLTGDANDLYLVLWNRASLDKVDVAGDRSLLDLWRDKANVRWS